MDSLGHSTSHDEDTVTVSPKTTALKRKMANGHNPTHINGPVVAATIHKSSSIRDWDPPARWIEVPKHHSATALMSLVAWPRKWRWGVEWRSESDRFAYASDRWNFLVDPPVYPEANMYGSWTTPQASSALTFGPSDPTNPMCYCENVLAEADQPSSRSWDDLCHPSTCSMQERYKMPWVLILRHGGLE